MSLFIGPLISVIGGIVAAVISLYFMRKKREAETLKDKADASKIFVEAAGNLATVSASHVERLLKENQRLRETLVKLWEGLENNREELEAAGIAPKYLPSKEEMIEIEGIISDDNGGVQLENIDLS